MMDAVKEKSGKMLSTESEVQCRWQEHFSADPEHPAEVSEENFLEELNISEEPPTKEEIISTVRELKNVITRCFEGRPSHNNRYTGKVTKEDMGAGELTRGLEKRSDHQATKERRPYKMWKLGLLSMVGKVLGRSIIKRIRDEVDRRLRKEQGGFRPNRGTAMQIFIL